MATLFESQGHEVWVKLREHIGAPVDPALAAATPKRQQTIAEREAEKAAKVSLAAQNTKALARVAEACKPKPAPCCLGFAQLNDCAQHDNDCATVRAAAIAWWETVMAREEAQDALDESLFGPIDVVELAATDQQRRDHEAQAAIAFGPHASTES